MSYARFDDSDGRLSRFRNLLERELRWQAGTAIPIFQDSDDIALGQPWRKRLDEGLAEATLLLPIITPSFFRSRPCRDEYETFRRHEQALERDDLILPVYFIDCAYLLSPPPEEAAAATARSVLDRQYFDWRHLRLLRPSDQRVERSRAALSTQILAAMARAPARAAQAAPTLAVSGPASPDPAVSAPRALSESVKPPVPTPTARPTSSESESRAPQPSPAALSDALRACCVRIDVGGRQAGSGFFAAPGIVVTCSHVLRLGDLSSEEARSSDEASASMSVRSQAGDSYEVLDTRELSEEDDLAILRVEPAHDHPFVLLDTGLRARDAYDTFGFSVEHPSGVSVTLTALGWLDVDRTLAVAPADVALGMSGSPVLNRRTGAVCGILTRGDHPAARGRRARDVRPASGCHVIAVRRLFALAPTLRSANFGHHTTHRKSWFGSLPPEQQRLLLAQRTSDPASLPECLLVISVDQSGDDLIVGAEVHRRRPDDGGWIAEASLGPARMDLGRMGTRLFRAFQDSAAWNDGHQGRVGPGEQIRLLGEILSRAVLIEEIGETFDMLIAGVELGWIEVALHFADIDDSDFRQFVELPWEHLYVPPRGRRGDVYFAREPKLAFVRTLYPEPRTPEPSDRGLSILVVAVKPEEADDYGPQHTRREVDDVTAALVALGRELTGSLDVTVIAAPGPHDLQDALRHRRYDAVHYVGFGQLDTGFDDRVALGAGSRYHGAEDFAARLEGDGMPRLVILQACRTWAGVPPDLAAFAPALLMKQRCDAVVAFQYPVPGELMRRFNTALYTALSEGTTLEMAAQTARKKVWAGDSEGRAFLSPAVFVRNPGGLRLAPERADTVT